MASPDRGIIWSEDAERDIDDIWDYLAAEASVRIADEAVRNIHRTCSILTNHPFLGRPRGELLPGMRSFLTHPYIAFYRVTGATIEIIRVLHQRRDIDAIFANVENR